MTVLDTARLIIYRVNKKGLEVFLVHAGASEDDDKWIIPKGFIKTLANASDAVDGFPIIELDPIKKKEGRIEHAFALEGDWHDIPSIRSILKADVKIVKDQIRQIFPELEQGTFVAFKEVFKKVLPSEYEFLRELKDILIDKNLATSI